MCTFYVNPGEEDFLKTYQSGYKKIADLGFEIGSHGYTHVSLSHLDNYDLLKQIELSYKKIESKFGISPLTFAFPHHDYDEKMLKIVRERYFETRNTLSKSQFFGLKTKVSYNDMLEKINKCVLNSPIVFAGHSVYLTEEEIRNANDKHKIGYKPIKLEDLRLLLGEIAMRKRLDVLTLAQAALKQYLMEHCYVASNYVEINDRQLEYLKKYKITKERIVDII